MRLTSAQRLLAFLGKWFEPTIVSRFFEPLIADWQREWADAQGLSASTRLSVAIRGLPALAITVLRCAASDFTTPPPAPAVIASAAAGAVAISLPVLVLTAITLFAVLPPRLPLDMLLILMAPQALSVGLAPAMLPSVFMLRRDRRTSWRNAAQVMAAGFALALVVAVWIVPLSSSGLLFTASQNERVYQLAVQNDRSGRPDYPGTAVRQARPSTAAERAERYARFRAQMEQMRANRPRPWASIRSFFRSYQFVWLTLAFGLMGWALGGLRRPTIAAAAGWWVLTWMVVFVPTILTRFSMVGWPAPYWLPTLLFGLSAVGLLRAAARRSTDQINGLPDQQVTR